MPRLVLKNVGGPGVVACFFGGEVSDRNVIFFSINSSEKKPRLGKKKPRLVEKSRD